MTRAQGSRIWDVDGNEYIDFHSSFGAVLLGHNDPRINAAVVRAMDEHGVSFSTANPLEVELAERLIDDDPVGRAGRVQLHRAPRRRITRSGWPAASRAASGSSSSRATTTAGTTTWRGAITSRPTRAAACPRPSRPRPGSRPRCATSSRSASTTTPPASASCSPARATRSRRSSSSRSSTTPGAVLPEPGFLEALREACTAAGTLLIFDEVITGFRHGPGGAQGRYGVTPGPDDDGQGARQRLPDLGAGRSGRHHGPPRARRATSSSPARSRARSSAARSRSRSPGSSRRGRSTRT